MNADKKEEILDGVRIFLLIGFIISLVLIPTVIIESHKRRALEKLNRQLSQVQSKLEIKATTVNLQLPGDSFIYDEQGGTVTGDSQVSFNKESNKLNFKISYPRGLERSSKSIELSNKRNKNIYQVKHETHDDNVNSIKILISGLDTSLNWYLDQTRVNPSENGELEIELTPRTNWITNWLDTPLQMTKILIGYSQKDNSIQDGIILKYIP